MRILTLIPVLGLGATPLSAQECGGSFAGFVGALKQEAVARGHAPATVDRFLAGVRQDPAVLEADRRQGVFQMPFTDFARRLISQNRMTKGRAESGRVGTVVRLRGSL